MMFNFVYFRLYFVCLMFVSRKNIMMKTKKTIASYSNELNKHVHNCLITNSLDIELFYS